MTDFRIEYSQPWLLLLLIPAVVLTFLPYFRSAKKYRRTRNRILSIVFHLTALVLAINLLAGINFTYEIPNEENELILLVDSSDSGEERKDARDDFVASVINVCDGQYRLGVVKFGYDQKYVAEISADSQAVLEQYLTSEDPDTTATDLASAIKYASTLFTNPNTAKIVVISDGVETDNAATAVIKAIAADGIRVDTVHLPNEEHDEVQLVGAVLPEDVILGEPFVAELTLLRNTKIEDQPIKLTVYDNEEPVGESDIVMKREEETVEVALVVSERGMHEFTFKLETESDTVKENNEYHAFINLQIFDNILVLERRSGDGKALVEMLGESYNVATMSFDSDLSAIPRDVAELVDYEQIILVNVAYSDMPAGFEETLNRYVYELGGGLLTVGGENDMIGGMPVPHAYNRNDIANSTYFKQMLPVNAIDYTPPIAVMLVIDTSASMSGGRLPAAIEGAEACLSALNDRDFCGVMSFQTTSKEEAQVRPVSQREEILESIRDVDHSSGGSSTGGGTIFTDAIRLAGSSLSVINNVERKHIIMVTDGNPGDNYETYLPMIEENVLEGITMSVITVGSISPDLVEKMNKTAAAGEGMFYNIPEGKYEQIPEYMQRDLALEAIAEIAYGEDFRLTVKDRTTVVAGIEENAIPPLQGYYGTVAKADALVPLMGEYVPIYAEWKYGRGNVGSFMCDLNRLWSDQFMSDVVGQAIIYNIVDSIFPTEDVTIDDLEYVLKSDNYTNQLNVHGAAEGERVEVEVTPISESLASSLEEGVTVRTVEMNKRYQFAIKEPGLYRIRIKRVDAEGEPLSDITLHKVFSYSEEYNSFTDREPVGAELLSLIASDGRGAVIEDPATVFESFSKTLEREFDPRILFLIISIICVLLDIAVRKFKFKWPHELVREYKRKKAERAESGE